MQVSSSRAAPCLYCPPRRVRGGASRLRTSAPKTTSRAGFRPEVGTGAGCGGTGTGFEGLVRESPTAKNPARPPPPQPQAAALCLSRKMVLESLWGREGRPHHLPLNVNYAFMNVFIGSDAPLPLPPPSSPVCPARCGAVRGSWRGAGLGAPAGSRHCRRRWTGGSAESSGYCVRTGRDLRSAGDDRVPSDT